MLTCVDMQHCTCAHVGHRATLFMFVCTYVCVVWPLCHLYFSHHVVIRLHVYSEGLSHLSLTVIQDFNLHKVFLFTLLELNILDTETRK